MATSSAPLPTSRTRIPFRYPGGNQKASRYRIDEARLSGETLHFGIRVTKHVPVNGDHQRRSL
jgi:hypothetical protein